MRRQGKEIVRGRTHRMRCFQWTLSQRCPDGWGETGTWNGVVAPFSRKILIRITTDGLQQFKYVSSQFVGLRSPPVGNWDCLMEVRNLCSDVQTEVETSGLHLIEYILLSVSGVTSKPTERCMHLLGRDCAESQRLAGQRGPTCRDFYHRTRSGRCGLIGR